MREVCSVGKSRVVARLMWRKEGTESNEDV